MQLSCQGVLDPLRKGEMECYVNCDSELVRCFGRIWPTFCTDYIVATMAFSKSKLPDTKIRNVPTRGVDTLRSCFFRCIASILRYPRNVHTLRIDLLGVRRCPPTWSLGQSSWLQVALEPIWGKLGWWDKTSDIWGINLTASFCSYSSCIYIYICVCDNILYMHPYLLICSFICLIIFLC